MNFKLHFGELYSDNSINDKNNTFENYIPKCDKVKRILISFNCFSEYIKTGRFTLIAFLQSCGCRCSVSRSRGSVSDM